MGHGAMGAVYRAMDVRAGVDVALKHLVDTRMAARFEAEAQLLGMLDHPRVVRVLNSFEDDGEFLVMELVRGPNLRQLLEERGTPGLAPEEVWEIARETCDALQYVHEQQILHRDIKPENLILSDDGVVLVDFGIARAIVDGEDGTVGIGTPRYMAPEVLAGGPVSVRSDVFGVSATLWTLLTGKPPVYADRTSLRSVVPGVSEAVETALRSGLEIMPERRISSMAALAGALGVPIRRNQGASLAVSAVRDETERDLLEAIVGTAARVFGTSSASLALLDETTDELVYAAAWGVAAADIVGVRLPFGQGIAGAVVQSGDPSAVPDCRTDPRFAARIAEGTGYVPRSMLVVPLKRAERTIGALSFLDRRDGRPFRIDDADRVAPFADLAVVGLAVQAARRPA